jgi:uncharacterized protein
LSVPDIPIPYAVPAATPDVQAPLEPSDVVLDGYLGRRVAANVSNRLAAVELDPLLAGFRHRPGTHPWIGEHIGKWLHAATLAWSQSGDDELRARLDHAVVELVATQEPGGYLGTYRPGVRFGLTACADWDVWVHKYCLIGLLTYYRYTGVETALAACRRATDLLMRTFGTEPGQKSIIGAGTHVGMAATSVLEPVVLLYRLTGDERYLGFADYIVSAWDEPGGPRILSTLRDDGRVAAVANGKAYEMLANLVGLCELARATGVGDYLTPVALAWDDVVENHLYVTGTASLGEMFQRPHELPNPPSAHIGETCVTVTWLQLTHQLLRLTGDARYAAELERTAYNHLAAAQSPDGSEWCYYTPLQGHKRYGPGISCCVSSGPRAMAMLPTMVYGRTRDGGLQVNLFETSRASIRVDGAGVVVEQTSAVPFCGGMQMRFTSERPAELTVAIRAPSWTDGVLVDGPPGAEIGDGWLLIPCRSYTQDDVLRVGLDAGMRRVGGEHGNRGRVAIGYGPLILAYGTGEDERRRTPAFDVLATDARIQRPRDSADRSVEIAGTITNVVDGLVNEPVCFRPFAEAGADGAAYRIWAGEHQPDVEPSVLAGGTEIISAGGREEGSFLDYESYSFVSTHDGKDHDDEWFGVQLDHAVRFDRVTYAHGWSWLNGGWFDASARRPEIEIKATTNATWQSIGELRGYPPTTATDNAGLRGNERFALDLPGPVTAVAVRIRGRGSTGDQPGQRFATCAELAAYLVGEPS